MAHPGGRPPKFKDAKDLKEKIDAYFNICREQNRPLTLSGLALALGCDRGTILNYSTDSEFFSTIKEARDACENYAEEYLYSGKPAVGAIFNLKNNYGWKDETEQKFSGTLGITDLASAFAKKEGQE